MSLYQEMGISQEVLTFSEEILSGLKDRFEELDKIAEYNQYKVLHAMQKNRVSAECFAGTTGYGHNDLGRDVLEKVYADVFHTEAALVRPQITCGTHALATALSANLLPGDELLSPVGKPYDTLEEVIGIRESLCSLQEYGVTYRQVNLLEDGSFDYDGIREAIHDKTKLINKFMQEHDCKKISFTSVEREESELLSLMTSRPVKVSQILRSCNTSPSDRTIFPS